MSAPLVPLALAWMVGLLLAEHLALPWPFWLGAALLALLGGVAVARHGTAPAALSGGLPPRYVALALALMLLGGARGAAHRPNFGSGDLAHHNEGGRATLLGTVVRYPEARGTRTRYEVAVTELQMEGREPQRVRGRLLVSLPPYPAFQYGDRLRLSGEPVTPPVLEEFDYRAFLAHKRIFTLLEHGHAERVGDGGGHGLLRTLYALRQRAERTLQAILPEPHASLMSGILLGIESGIPAPVMEAFNRTGTTHVLVISGSNFAILSALFLLAGRRLLGERRGSLLALAGIALYALLVGADPPVLRAALMGGISVLALLLRREGTALNTLAFAVLAMTALQPGQLHDVGFQLSALATLGLIVFVPPITRHSEALLARVPALDTTGRARALALLGDVLLVTLAAQLITTPLIVGTFGRFSLVSLLTNLLILPVQSWLLVSGGLAAIAGMVWLPLGRLLAAGPYAGLAWTVAMVRWTATFPLASLAIGPFPTWSIWALYGTGAALWAARGGAAQRPDGAGGSAQPLATLPGALPHARRWLALGATVLVSSLLSLWLLRHLPDGRLHLYVLDVGQGDALLIVAPDGKQVLVDGGPDPVPLLSELGARLPPWDRTVELVVLSHADADHLGGLPELLGRYRAAQVVDSGFGHDTALYKAWVARLAAQGVTPVAAQPGQRWLLGGGAVLEVLAPSGPPFDSLNDNAVVMRLRYGEFCALLTGDIEAEAEARLVQSGLLGPCAVLKVAHHGSHSSSTEPLLDAIQPRYALISAGADNRFGHPHPDVLARYEARAIRLFRTDQQGTLHLWSDGRALWADSAR